MSLFKENEIIKGSDGNVYKVTYDYANSPCIECEFFKHRDEDTIKPWEKCTRILSKIFETEFIMRNYKGKKDCCYIIGENSKTKAHFIKVNVSDLLKPWKKFLNKKE